MIMITIHIYRDNNSKENDNNYSNDDTDNDEMIIIKIIMTKMIEQ